MSAYAVPGSIFPSLRGSCASRVNRENTFSSPMIPVGGKEKKGGIGHFSLDSVLAMSASNDAKDDQQDKRSPQESHEVGIAVKEAKIDPVRLVQTVVSAGDKRAHSQETPIEESSSCCQRSSHEDAIQFELSISFNGRSYSATRTFARLVQLRKDLIRELNSRRKGVQNQRMRWRPGDDDMVSTIHDREYEEVVIPEIPECSTENVTMNSRGVAGRGFAMLQALLGPYCPAIERWLQNVTDLVPPMSSPSLTNFLWEPVSTCSGMRSSPSLECIAEDSDSEGESEE